MVLIWDKGHGDEICPAVDKISVRCSFCRKIFFTFNFYVGMTMYKFSTLYNNAICSECEIAAYDFLMNLHKSED